MLLNLIDKVSSMSKIYRLQPGECILFVSLRCRRLFANRQSSSKTSLARGWFILLILSGLLRCTGVETNGPTTVTVPTEVNKHPSDGELERDKAQTVDAQTVALPKDTPEAVKWFQQAAAKGDAVSKFYLGGLYSKGEGVSLDYVEAYKWYNLAAANGFVKAAEPLNSLVSLMTPDQIAEGQRRSIEFLLTEHPENQGGGGATACLLGSHNTSGSGFFITEDGYLLANGRLVGGAARCVVKTTLGEFPATLVKLDSVTDIAVLKVSGKFHPLPLISSRTVKLGDTVFTIGFQNQQSQALGAKLTDGKINSLADALNDARVFQISLPVQADNCGGALVTSSGNVVGVIAAQVYDKATCNTNGAAAQNVNYAIKSSYVLSLLESLPEVANKLKEPSSAKEHKFEDLVKEALEAAAVVQVY
jgi:S1-C subfamily serine protease